MSITGSEQWMYSSGREFYDFPLEQSLRTASGYLTRTFASAGDSKKMTISLWVKRANIDTGKQHFLLRSVVSTYDAFWIQTDYKLRLVLDSFNAYAIHWDGLMRDTSAWYHIVLAIDTTQATPANRFRCFRNGEELTYTGTVPPQNYNLANFNKAVQHGISYEPNGGFIDGYIAEYNFIDGTAYDASYFGELKSGIWIPKDPTGLTYGTNGFRLNFADTVTASGFNTLTYSGDNLNPKSVNGCGFSPDFVWVKQRTNNGGGATFHQLYDSVRGTQKLLRSNTTDVELANPSNGGVQSFDADGFTIQGSSASLNMNGSGETYVAWTWDAGSGSAASNTDGSITSTVKANTDYGFSIVSYTGTGSATSWGHGLGVQPDMVIVKNRSGTNNWAVYHSEVPATQALLLSATNAAFTTGYWNNTAPTSSIVNISGDGIVNTSGNNYIAYCFAEKTGFSSISSYTGDGTTDGSKTITTGFKPAFVMMKNASTGSTNWLMFDNTRDTKQTIELELNANNSNAEANNGRDVTFTDTGFTVAGNNNINGSGDTYIYMAFADTRDAAFWRDVSGQGNDWQPNNLTFSDVVPDAPSNNFAVVPSTTLPSTGYSQHTEGNLQLYQPSWGGWDINLANFHLPSSGKYYWEIMPVQGIFNAGFGAFIFGIGNIRGRENISGFPTFGNPLVQVDSRGIGEYRQYPSWVDYTKSGNFGFTVGSTVYGIAVDCDNKKFWFSLNNSWAGTSGTTLTAGTGDPANGTNGDPISGDMTDYVPFFNVGDQQSSCRLGINFGQDSTFAGARAAGGNADENGYGDFAYAPPSGFLSLCSANLPTGAIDTLADETPEDYFNTVLYSGNSTNNTPITVGFEPSMTWIKTRNVVRDHRLMDAVRGATAGIYPNLTNAEGASPLLSFDSDGFTLNNTDNYNNTGETYASWNWKAGGAGVSNTDGSITSTVSVGATSQQNWFSIVKYTGSGGSDDYGHGLGIAPNMIITKDMTDPANWAVYVSDIGTGKYLQLNSTAATVTNSAIYPSVSSTTIGVGVQGDGSITNTSGDNYISYCFANAEGLCKVGSYTGNGSTDGSFIYTGFRPAWVMVKKTSGVGQWRILDANRNLFNITDLSLGADRSDAEQDMNDGLDFTTNGFKVRTTRADYNTSGGNYIYLAIAEQPFKYANAR